MVHNFESRGVRHLEFKNFHIWSSGCQWVENLLLHTEFHRKMIIFRWDVAIWRFSAILNFRGPLMASLESPCRTSYRSSIIAIGMCQFVRDSNQQRCFWTRSTEYLVSGEVHWIFAPALNCLLSRRSRQRERLSASVLSICSSVSLLVRLCQNAKTRFSQKLSNLELWRLLTTYKKSAPCDICLKVCRI